MEVVAFEVPAGGAPDQFALATTRTLRVQPSVFVRESDGRGAAVGTLGDLDLGVHARVGPSWAGRSATLRNRSRVEGLLHVDGAVTIGRDVRIDGGTVRDGPFSPGAPTSFYVPSPASAVTALSLRPGESRIAEPGIYSVIEVKPGAVLHLRPGVYATRELRVSPGARVVTSPATGGPTILAVTAIASYHGSIESTSADPSLLLAYLGTNSLQLHTAFNGWVVAPSSELVLAGMEHRGAFFADEIRVLPNAVVTHVPFPLDFVRGARGACSLEPRVTCVRDLGGGGYIAVFGYSNALPHFGAVVPIGPFNDLVGGDPDAFPRQAFLPRGEQEAFEVAFNDSVTWVLGGRRATATRTGDPACP